MKMYYKEAIGYCKAVVIRESVFDALRYVPALWNLVSALLSVRKLIGVPCLQVINCLLFQVQEQDSRQLHQLCPTSVKPFVSCCLLLIPCFCFLHWGGQTLGSPSLLSCRLHLLAFPSLLTVMSLSNKKLGSYNPIYHIYNYKIYIKYIKVYKIKYI